MKSTKLASSLCTGLVTLSQPVCLAAADVPAAGTPPKMADIANLPHYIVMKDSLGQFADPRDHDSDFFYLLNGASDCDDGLAGSGHVRDFILGYPYCHAADNPETSGRFISDVVLFCDAHGLYQLGELASRRAQKLAALPLADLGPDGLIGLLKTASYYRQTGRIVDADKIYRNLTSKVWPEYSYKGLSATVLFYYADYLDSVGQKSKSAPIRDKATKLRDAIYSTPQTGSDNVYYPNDVGLSTLDSDVIQSIAAYNLISTRQWAKADIVLHALVQRESARKVHASVSLMRLVNLARAMAQLGQTESARKILEKVFTLTESDLLSNVRFYVAVQLFTLPSSDIASTGKSWGDVDQAARRMHKLVALISLQPESDKSALDDELLHYFDVLALNMSYNGENGSAYKLFEKALSVYRPNAEHKPTINFHRAYLAAQAAKYDEIMPDVEADIKTVADFSWYADIMTRIFEVCSKAGRADLIDPMARAIIQARINKRSADGELPEDKNCSAQQREENQAFRLANDLSLIYFYRGKSLNNRGAFAEAEAELKKVQRIANSFVYVHPWTLAIELGRSLEAQKKYSEAIDVYAKASGDSHHLQIPLLQALAKAMSNMPSMSDEMQVKALEICRNLYMAKLGRLIANELAALLPPAKKLNWNQSNLLQLSESVNIAYRADGKVDDEKP